MTLTSMTFKERHHEIIDSCYVEVKEQEKLMDRGRKQSVATLGLVVMGKRHKGLSCCGSLLGSGCLAVLSL